MQHNGNGCRVETIDRAHRGTGCIGAMHARHRNRQLTWPAGTNGDHAATVNTPRHLILVLAGCDTSIAFNAAFGVAKKFHSGHTQSPYATLIWQSVALGSCMFVTG